MGKGRGIKFECRFMEKITTQSTSKYTSVVSDLVLRKTNTTRLIFRPLIIDNANNKEASVKGWFIFQKKSLKDNWCDYKTFDLSKLKKGEWIKLELKAEEVLKLLEKSNQYKTIYKKYGITYGTSDFIITDRNIGHVFEQIASFSNQKILLDALQNLNELSVQKLNALVGVSQLEKALKIWNTNKDNNDENFWMTTFKTYSWIISQVFACPYVFIDDGYYFGGKRGENKGGVYGDLLYQNYFTGNVAFVEIKTPSTEIIGSKYRGNNDVDNNTVYSFSSDISGGVTQVLNQRNIFKQKQDSLEESNKKILNSKCILLVGKVDDLSLGQKKSFDLYRNNLKDVEIVAYDELFIRVENLKDLFEK